MCAPCTFGGFLGTGNRALGNGLPAGNCLERVSAGNWKECLPERGTKRFRFPALCRKPAIPRGTLAIRSDQFRILQDRLSRARDRSFSPTRPVGSLLSASTSDAAPPILHGRGIGPPSVLGNAGRRALHGPAAVAGHSREGLAPGQIGPKAVSKRALSSNSCPPTRGIGQEPDQSGPPVCSPSWLTRPEVLLHFAYDGFLLPSSLIQVRPGISGTCYGAKLRIAPAEFPSACSTARFAAR